MAKFYYENVCRCMSDGSMKFLIRDVMQNIFDERQHEIEKTESLREKASKALYLGSLCEEAGFPHLALQTWRAALAAIEDGDEERVLTLMYRADFVFRDNVTAEPALQLAHRIDLLLRRLGVRPRKSNRLRVMHSYRMLWYDVYYEYLP